MSVNVALEGGYKSDRINASGIEAGFDARHSGQNVINVTGAIDVTVHGNSNASGVLAQGNQSTIASNTISSDSFSLSVTNTGDIAGSRATGVENSVSPISTSSGGENIITVGHDTTIDVSAQGQAALAAGFYSTGIGTQTLTAGGDVDVNVTSTAGKAYGVFGGSSITGDSVTMTIKGDLSAIVLDGKATVTGSTISLNAESANGTSYGMYSPGSGFSVVSNTVQSSSGQALNLEISADYAMYATAGKNVILGHSVSGGEGDVIQLNGDIYRSGSGSNQITTGAGNDTIILDGIISGAGALTVDGGAGADTLILQAADLGEFIARYGSWLNGLGSTILKGVEKIEFSGIDDLNDLRPGLDNFFTFVDGVQPPIEVSIHEPDFAISAFSDFGLHDDGLLFDDVLDHHDQGQGTSHVANENDHGDSVHGVFGDSLVAGLDAQGHATSNVPDLPNLPDSSMSTGSSAAESSLTGDSYAHVGLNSGEESLDNLLPGKESSTPVGSATENTNIEAVLISTVTDTAQEMINVAARQTEAC